MMLGPGVEFTLPPSSFFKFPPDPFPWTVPPPEPSEDFTPKAPINVDIDLFNKSLAPQLPVTFALGYITFALIFNRVNRSRHHKPWAISKTWLFHTFVLLHNVTLAVFSGVTCAALIRAVVVSWPGLDSLGGLATAVDSLCKIHGPRGYGDAVTYDATRLVWSVKNKAIHLGIGGLLPDSTDVGRIWNEGLAFWGWLFYLSKFYEVVDTLIILLKGKRSSTLQTYHHAGAMLCMWAGIRYMSPPIWMFVLVNSGIHTLMYTYYTLAALKIGVKNGIKGMITTLQIIQFVVGASYASLHLFISYSIPVATRYYVASAIQSVASPIASAAHVDTPSWLKRLAYRAAGAEGLAERVMDRSGRSLLPHFTLPSTPSTTVRYRSRYEMTRCLDTSGEAFAIWLNVVYLAPLTLMFLRFFWKTYVSGTRYTAGEPAKGKGRKDRRISDAAFEAGRETGKKVEEIGGKVEDVIVGAVGEEVVSGGRGVKIEEESSSYESSYRGSSGYRESSSYEVRESSESYSSSGGMTVEGIQAKFKESAKDLKESLSGLSVSDSVEWVERKMVDSTIDVHAREEAIGEEERLAREVQLREEEAADEAEEEREEVEKSKKSNKATAAAAAAVAAMTTKEESKGSSNSSRGLQKTAFSTASEASEGQSSVSRTTSTTSSTSRTSQSASKKTSGGGKMMEEGAWLGSSGMFQRDARVEEAPQTPRKGEEKETETETETGASPDWGFGLRG